MNTCSRREFVAALTSAAVSAPFLGAAPAPAGPAESCKLCVFSKHLLFLLDYQEMAETAAEAGFDGVDLAVRPGGHVLPENVKRHLPRAVAAIQKAGLQSCMMTTAITDAQDPATEAILGTAADLGIRYYRMGWVSYEERLGVAKSLEALKPGFAALAALNEKRQIHGAYQNHAGTRVGGPVWDLWGLLRECNPRWFGCQYDVRHATVEGGSAWPLGLKLLAPWIKITALKDFLWSKETGRWEPKNVPLGEGMTDFTAYFKLVKQLGLRGPISLHFEYPMTAQPEASLPKAEARRQVVAAMKQDLAVVRGWLKPLGL